MNPGQTLTFTSVNSSYKPVIHDLILFVSNEPKAVISLKAPNRLRIKTAYNFPSLHQ